MKTIQSKRFEKFQDRIYESFGDDASFLCNAQSWSGFLFEHYTLVIDTNPKQVSIQFMVKHFTLNQRDNGFQIFFEAEGNSFDSVIEILNQKLDEVINSLTHPKP